MYHIIYVAIEGVTIGGYMIYKKSVVLTSVSGGKEKAVLTLVSATSIVEGGAHDVIQKDKTNTVK